MVNTVKAMERPDIINCHSYIPTETAVKFSYLVLKTNIKKDVMEYILNKTGEVLRSHPQKHPFFSNLTTGSNGFSS